jgi:hypothetical protein
VILRTTTGATLPVLVNNVLCATNFDNLLSIGQLRNDSKRARQPTFDWRDTEGILRFRFPGMSNWVDVAHTVMQNCYYLQTVQCGPQCFTPKPAAAVLPRPIYITSIKAQQRPGFINPTSLAKTIANTVGITLLDNPAKLSV